MVDITTRVLGTTPKNSPLTNQEVDQNFLNLKQKVEEVDQSILPVANDVALVLSIALG
jgi:hypothetical protein